MLTGLLAAVTLSAPGLPAPAPAPRPTIAAIVAQSGGVFDENRNDFDMLLTAVQAAGLVGVLDDPTIDVTVFAPTDRAFIRLARDLGFSGNDEAGAWQFLVGALTTLGDGDPIGPLTQILTYHVAPESLSLGEVVIYGIFGVPIPTLQGGELEWTFRGFIDAEPDLRNPQVTFPLNIRASNGIIHAIDGVLLPIDLP